MESTETTTATNNNNNIATANLTPEQCKILDQFRSIIHNDNTLSERQRAWCDDMCLCRYLRARSWDLAKAEAMIRETIKWRAEYKPDLMTAADVETHLAHGHMYFNGVDRQGRPIMVLRVHETEDPHTREQKLQFMIYMIERCIQTMDKSKGIEKMVWICSCVGYNWKYNGDHRFATMLISTLQSHYPERLHKLFVVDPPMLFSIMYKMAYPFIDEQTRQKVVFVSGQRDDKIKAFEPHMEMNQLEALFHGTNGYSYDKESYMKMLQDLDERAKYTVY